MTLDDLIAARFVGQIYPELAGRATQQLTSLDEQEGAAGFRTLLGELLRARVLTRARAERIHEAVEERKRSLALGIFAELVVRSGVLERQPLADLVSDLGSGADVSVLTSRLVAEGRLTREQADALAFQARRVYDRDASAQVDAHRARRAAEAASVGATLVAGELLPEAFAPELSPSDEVMIRSEAMTAVVDRASLAADLAPPTFEIPDWVDTCEPLVGRRIGGFRVLGLIGRGAMAKVYLADHPDHEVPIALKVLPPEANAERKARFKREILANGFFSHPQVIDVYDAGVSDDDHSYLAMEFFDGTDLERVLETEGSISMRQSLSLTRQLLQALSVAHQAGIVHRDIKPGNIMVSASGYEAKLTDFGIALIRDLGEFKDKVFESDAGGITGTPEYLSPEQAFRDPVGPPSDLYALGMVLYRCLAGRLPYEAESIPSWVNAHISGTPLPLDQAAPQGEWPEALLTLLDRLFVKNPRDRLQSAEEALEAIDALFLELESGRRSRFFSKIRRGF